MRITNKFVEPIPLDQIDDARDGSRVAMRPGAQTISGTKSFEALRLASDPEKGDTSLVNVADMNEALSEAGTPLTLTESVTLSAADITARALTLQRTPQEGSLVKFSLEGSGFFNSVTDFTVAGKTISWADNAALCALLGEGDALHVRYFTVKAE